MTNTAQQQTYEIPQRMLVLRDFCIRTHGSSCTRCAQACAHNALSFAENQPPVINSNACTLCGACQGTCDAFSPTTNTLAELHAQARKAALGNRPCIITCTENAKDSQHELASNVVVTPCLAALPAEAWCALLAEGSTVEVSLDLARCETCLHAGACAEELYSTAIARAEQWTERSIGFRENLPYAKDEGLLAGLANAGADGDRRALFTDMLAQLKDAASGALRERTDEHLQTLREQNQRLAAHQRLHLGTGTQFNRFAPLGRTRQIMGLSRKLLLQAIDSDPSIAARTQLPFPLTNDQCENCLACTKACPTGARLPSAEDGTLVFDWRYCIGCGLCESACPNHAIALTNEFIADMAC